ncbi:acyl CoA:acetate/3-ketoacid CoA transferase [Pseudomonas sp. UBA1879]|uniref:acyl CoA:acetate/3-ketoacid CoA transferase n=1 Tax=Pseudomonas sp. UBA1879 TaxID=1947305 RepID=UPI0025CCAE43|nr:CoA-transferase [Pseudomonas sp. UBA1879]
MRIIDADEAAALVQDQDAVLVSGSGGGHAVPEALLAALGRRFEREGLPRNLTAISVVGVGDRKSLGADHFAKPGLVARSISSALIDSPALMRMAVADQIQAYTIPQGVLSQLMREMAGGRPGLLSKTGLYTFIDPRQLGGRQTPSTPEGFVELKEIDGEEWLFYRPLPLNVVFLRGTTVDEDGNVTMEEEAVLGEMLAMAQAARRVGGTIIVQAKRLAKRGTLPPKQVKIPGILVDFVVIEPEQRQTYATAYDPSYSGQLRIPLDGIRALPFSPRKVVVRRAAMELYAGAVCNLGAGISTGLAAVAAEEALLDSVVLTNEQGVIGGAPITGPDSGGGQNYQAMVEQPSQFDFYDGGGLDLAFLSFAEVDAEGNVNISRFGDVIVGVGGFINISQNARTVVFSGTLTAGGLDVQWKNGRTEIRQEGRHCKFVSQLEQVCFSARLSRERGQKVLFVTERAVFRVGKTGLELIEIAPGVDVERDIFANMDFRVPVAADLREMDPRIFSEAKMGIREDVDARPRVYRSPRLQAWIETREAQ